MKKAAVVLVGLVLSVALSGCGGGVSEADAEKDARDELKALGLPKTLTDCAIKEIKKEAGSFAEFRELSASKQQTIAAEAGSECSKDLSEDEVGDLADTMEDQDLDLSNPAFRKSYITGMTSQGVPEDLANCIVDKAIAQELTAKELVDPQKIQVLAGECR